MTWTKGHGFDALRVCLWLRGYQESMITDEPTLHDGGDIL